ITQTSSASDGRDPGPACANWAAPPTIGLRPLGMFVVLSKADEQPPKKRLRLSTPALAALTINTLRTDWPFVRFGLFMLHLLLNTGLTRETRAFVVRRHLKFHGIHGRRGTADTDVNGRDAGPPFRQVLRGGRVKRSENGPLLLNRLWVVIRRFLERGMLPAFDADDLYVAGSGGEGELVGGERPGAGIDEDVQGIETDGGGLLGFL